MRTDDVLPLVVAGVFAGLTAWWGPGGASLRRGSRSIVRGLTPGEAAGQVAAGILLVVAAVVLAMTLAGAGPSVVATHDGARLGVPGGADAVSRPPRDRHGRKFQGESPTEPMPMADLLRRTPYRHTRIPGEAAEDTQVR